MRRIDLGELCMTNIQFKLKRRISASYCKQNLSSTAQVFGSALGLPKDYIKYKSL